MAQQIIRLRPGRELSKRGGHGIARQLQSMHSNPWVFWSPRKPSGGGCNSFVCVADGDAFSIYSINGIGEIRWKLESWNKDDESNAARDYFLVQE